MNEIEVINVDISTKIYTIRGLQVMLDRDLAVLYQVETKQLNKSVKRNIKRFPKEFMFQLTKEELDILRFQFGTSSEHGGTRYLPYVFTEQGVSMLSAIIRSDIAIDISIHIIKSFVSMRKFISLNATIFQRLENIEQKQQLADKKIDEVFNAIEDKSIKPKQGIFYDGQIFDAYLFVNKIIKSANKKIVLIDNYCDDTVLTMFSKNQNIDVYIYTKNISKQLKLDIEKYNSQYKPITLKEFKNSHDRFIIVDDKDVYHLGASLKDLGKKWFAFSKFDIQAINILDRLASI